MQIFFKNKNMGKHMKLGTLKMYPFSPSPSFCSIPKEDKSKTHTFPPHLPNT